MISLSTSPLSVSIHHWLRPSAAWLLAAAMASGAFSLPSFGAIPSTLKWMLEPRYTCLLFALLAGIVTRPIGRPANSSAEGLCLILLWLAYATYAFARSIWILPAVPAWSALEPVFLVLLALITTLVVVDSRQQAIHFAVAFLVLLVGAAIVFTIIDSQTGTDPPFHAFYSSRTFFIGAAFAAYFAATKPAKSIDFASAIGVAAFLLYVGLASVMRASILFYAVSLLFAACLLIAARQLRAIVLVVAIAVSSYALHWQLNSGAIHDKINAYSHVRPSSFENAEGEPRNEACWNRIAAASIEPALTGNEKYSCQMHFTIFDVDSRIRLLLQAISTNNSPVYGSGLGTFRFIEASRSASVVGIYPYPHNILAEVYHATGLVGLTIIGASIIIVVALVLRLAVTSASPIGILAAIPAFSGFSALIGGNLYDGRFLWIAPLIMVALVAPCRVESEQG